MRSTVAKTGPQQALASQLLDWYDHHGRCLPWRARTGQTPDPYRVWLSEIMLQQTTVAAVKPYFEKFLSLWPTVEALAAAPLDDVLTAWAGLGYYARARNLLACAKAVAARPGGRFPDTVEELRRLPGIGPYTAAAIAAIAFDRPHAAVDGNVERVISRLHALETPLPDARPMIRSLAAALVPERRAGDFAQAIMDLGATVCTPRSPDCAACPWSDHCAGRMAGIAATLPRKRPKAAVPVRHGVAFWIERPDGAVLLRRRPQTGLLGGLMEVPSTPWGEQPETPEEHAPLPAQWQRLQGRVSHAFTHFRLELEVWTAIVEGDALPPSCHWASKADLAAAALPTVMRKVVGFVLSPGQPPRKPPH